MNKKIGRSTNTDIEWQEVEASNVPVVAEGKHLEF